MTTFPTPQRNILAASRIKTEIKIGEFPNLRVRNERKRTPFRKVEGRNGGGKKPSEKIFWGGEGWGQANGKRQ